MEGEECVLEGTSSGPPDEERGVGGIVGRGGREGMGVAVGESVKDSLKKSSLISSCC